MRAARIGNAGMRVLTRVMAIIHVAVAVHMLAEALKRLLPALAFMPEHAEPSVSTRTA